MAKHRSYVLGSTGKSGVSLGRHRRRAGLTMNRLEAALVQSRTPNASVFWKEHGTLTVHVSGPSNNVAKRRADRLGRIFRRIGAQRVKVMRGGATHDYRPIWVVEATPVGRPVALPPARLQ